MDTLFALLLHRDPTVRSLFRATAFLLIAALVCRFALPQFLALRSIIEGIAILLLYWAVNVGLWPAVPSALDSRLAEISARADALLDHPRKHAVGMLDPLFFRGHRAHRLLGSIHVTPRSVAELNEDALCWMILCAHLRSQMFRSFVKNMALAMVAVGLLCATWASALGFGGILSVILVSMAGAAVISVHAVRKRGDLARKLADELMGQTGLGEMTERPTRKWTYASAFDHRGGVSVLEE